MSVIRKESCDNGYGYQSLPARGAWIEIFVELMTIFYTFGPVPYGAGGLKSPPAVETVGVSKSRPVWGEWIEMRSTGRIRL